MGSKPIPRLRPTEQLERDYGAAAARTTDRRVEAGEWLVGRDQDAELQTLADQPVHQVEQPSQSLPGALLGVGGEKLIAIFQDKEARRAGLPLVVIVEEDVYKVARF